MQRNFLESTGRAAVLSAFLLGLFVPSGTRAQGNGQAPAEALGRERHSRVWLKIMAFADAPVVGGDVRVRVHGRLLVDAKAATNNQGVFSAPVSRPWFLGELADADANASGFDRSRRQSLVRISISGGTINGEPFLGL